MQNTNKGNKQQYSTLGALNAIKKNSLNDGSVPEKCISEVCYFLSEAIRRF
jgi:hypothetical protein